MKKIISILGVSVIVLFAVKQIIPSNAKDLENKNARVVMTDDDVEKAQEEERKRKEAEIRTQEESKVEKIVLDDVGKYKENIGLYYYNLSNGAEYSLNADKEFRTASTIKVPQVMLILDDVQAGRLSLDTMMTYNKETDYESGTGTLQSRDYIGQISVKEAVDLSMTVSDNIAYKMLKRYGSMSAQEYITKITGISSSTGKSLTPRQAMLLMKRLYENPDNNPYYDGLIETLKNTVFNDTIDKYIDDEVAHKIGSYYRYYHDIGIVYGDSDYILAIYTKDVGPMPSNYGEQDEVALTDDGDFANETIATIAKDIHSIHLINYNTENAEQIEIE